MNGRLDDPVPGQMTLEDCLAEPEPEPRRAHGDTDPLPRKRGTAVARPRPGRVNQEAPSKP